jgi:hypothetical protein
VSGQDGLTTHPVSRNTHGTDAYPQRSSTELDYDNDNDNDNDNDRDVAQAPPRKAPISRTAETSKVMATATPWRRLIPKVCRMM